MTETDWVIVETLVLAHLKGARKPMTCADLVEVLRWSPITEVVAKHYGASRLDEMIHRTLMRLLVRCQIRSVHTGSTYAFEAVSLLESLALAASSA